MRLLSEVVGREGTHGFLRRVDDAQGSLTYEELYRLMTESSVKQVDDLFTEIISYGLITELQGSYFLSTMGRRARLLLDALNGGDIEDMYRKLSILYPYVQKYELVREGMALSFIEGLYDRPDFGSVYLCSPWIHMKQKVLGKFAYAFYKAEETLKRKIELFVITKPVDTKRSDADAIASTLNSLKNLGAQIVYKRQLHSKLYIREPGPSGGLLLAVFGSENLSVRQSIELGIRIKNDTEMVRKLISYFQEISVNGTAT